MLPHVIVGDGAFPLKTYLMQTHPGQNLTHEKWIFKYRLSQVCHVVENVF